MSDAVSVRSYCTVMTLPARTGSGLWRDATGELSAWYRSMAEVFLSEVITTLRGPCMYRVQPPVPFAQGKGLKLVDRRV